MLRDDEDEAPETEEPETESPAEKEEPEKKTKKATVKTKTAVAKKPSVKKKPAAEIKSPGKDKSYGIDFIAKELKKEPNVVRIMLRRNKIKKNGKKYSWPTKVDAEAVVKKLRAASK